MKAVDATHGCVDACPGVLFMIDLLFTRLHIPT
jgi:hypothetical protein